MKTANEGPIQLDFEKITDVTIGELYRSKKEAIVNVIVNDEEYDDVFTIKLQRTNLGIGGLCFLGNQPSYQADFLSGESLKLKEVINRISGGEVFSI
ncbi:hypothetical protein [Endozoicomonas sp. ALC066]|uniref:hypothetical protein n=1 Tax=Endozoicomonas sp. ALC066 TaxID=3403078 RepID=UPI003BB7D2F5